MRIQELSLYSTFLVILVHSGDIQGHPVVDPLVLDTLKRDRTVEIRISFKDADTASVRAKLGHRSFSSREDKATALRNTLKGHADSVQSPILQHFDRLQRAHPDILVHQLWISTELIVKNVDKRMLEELLQDFGAQIREIHGNHIIPLVDTIPTSPVIIHESEGQSRTDESEEQNRTGRETNCADRPFHAELWGHNRTGIWNCSEVEGPDLDHLIYVAHIDTGVRGDHESLKNSYANCSYNGTNNSQMDVPMDNHDHGTHTMGTIAGDCRFGGTPSNVKWMTCVGCLPIGCPMNGLLTCGQWLTCPGSGTDPVSCKPADVINNSWGGGPSGDFYDEVIQGWIFCGIIPVFSAGNSGECCGTAGYPGNHPLVTAVGASDEEDYLAGFSSRGPTFCSMKEKPDVTCPGVDIAAPINESSTAYRKLSGTSMAAPHFTAIIARLMAFCPDASPEDVLDCALRKEPCGDSLGPPGFGLKTDYCGYRVMPVKYDDVCGYWAGGKDGLEQPPRYESNSVGIGMANYCVALKCLKHANKC